MISTHPNLNSLIARRRPGWLPTRADPRIASPGCGASPSGSAQPIARGSCAILWGRTGPESLPCPLSCPLLAVDPGAAEILGRGHLIGVAAQRPDDLRVAVSDHTALVVPHEPVRELPHDTTLAEGDRDECLSRRPVALPDLQVDRCLVVGAVPRVISAE